jgi:hypothetical protein
MEEKDNTETEKNEYKIDIQKCIYLHVLGPDT